MGEAETDILESICGLYRHQNAAQTVRLKRYSCCIDERIWLVFRSSAPSF